MRVGVLEILIPDVAPGALWRLHARNLNRHYASIMPQAVSVWSRSLGHETFYATYWGQADPAKLLPDDLDVLFVCAFTSASALAAAISRVYAARGTLTVLGGPHARGYPEDARRFFDVVVGDCDRTLVDEILRDRPRGVSVSSDRPLRELPTVEERRPEIEIAHFPKGRAGSRTFVPILASVGCPYACDFCADWDNPYRLLPLERLEADLRYVADHFPNVSIPYHDPNFAIRFDEVLDVLERIPERRRNRYVIQTSLSVLSEERLARLRDTRCAYIAPGVESWADYSGKSDVSRGCSGREKLERVVAAFERIRRFVPGMQANFIFGVDADAGSEPMELTREFARRVPDAWPNLNVPTPFGGTPLYESHLAEGRILRKMPFALYYTPYLVTRLLHYSPEAYYAHAAELMGDLISRSLTWRRAHRLRGLHHLLHMLHLVQARLLLSEFRQLRERLLGDRAFRRFHDGESESLPPFYRERLRLQLGRYLELLTPEDLVPRLSAGRASTATGRAAAVA